MNEVNNFENAKVGDKVWCLLNGEGEVRPLSDSDLQSELYPVYVRFESVANCYTTNGKMRTYQKNPCLFREKPTVTAPEPKKKVKNTFWVVWYKHVRGENIYGASFDGESGYARFCASLEGSYEVLKTEKLEREFEI